MTGNLDCSTPAERENINRVLHMYDHVVNERDIDAADQYLAAGFLQHNPLYGEGVAGFKDYVGGELHARFPNLNVVTEVAIAQNDRVFTFTTWRGRQVADQRDLHLASCDIYRLHDGKINEHWDLIEYTELAKFGITRPEMNQPTTPIDRTGTDAQRLNLGITLGFFSDITVQDASRAPLYITDDFGQFEPHLEPGLEGFQTCFEGFCPLAPDLNVGINHLVVGSRHVGLILLSLGTNPSTGGQFILPTGDVYRIQDDMLDYHWGMVDYTDIVSLIGFNPKEMLAEQNA